MTNNRPHLTNNRPLLTNNRPLLTNNRPLLTSNRPLLTNERPLLTNNRPLLYWSHIYLNRPGYVALLMDRLASHTAAGRPVSGSLGYAPLSKETFVYGKRGLLTLAYLRYGACSVCVYAISMYAARSLYVACASVQHAVYEVQIEEHYDMLYLCEWMIASHGT